MNGEDQGKTTASKSKEAGLARHQPGLQFFGRCESGPLARVFISSAQRTKNTGEYMGGFSFPNHSYPPWGPVLRLEATASGKAVADKAGKPAPQCRGTYQRMFVPNTLFASPATCKLGIRTTWPIHSWSLNSFRLKRFGRAL